MDGLTYWEHWICISLFCPYGLQQNNGLLVTILQFSPVRKLGSLTAGRGCRTLQVLIIWRRKERLNEGRPTPATIPVLPTSRCTFPQCWTPKEKVTTPSSKGVTWPRTSRFSHCRIRHFTNCTFEVDILVYRYLEFYRYSSTSKLISVISRLSFSWCFNFKCDAEWDTIVFNMTSISNLKTYVLGWTGTSFSHKNARGSILV